ncbi:hypothetical protein [Acetobacter sp.]|uniref:hypothetical protein n=1 Tax=Acetobacter sp. TaxID=440 RepID=UPI0039EC3544
MTVISDALVDLSHDERAAVWMIRYFAGPGRPYCRHDAGSIGGLFFRQDLDTLRDVFRQALDRCVGCGVQLPDIRTRGCDAVTLAERVLLDATAQAQSGDEHGMRATLRRVFAQRHVIASFATVMTQLAACLASAGYWLLSRACVRPDTLGDAQAMPKKPVRRKKAEAVTASLTKPVAAASLTALARWRTNDMAMAQVLWPVAHRVAASA